MIEIRVLGPIEVVDSTGPAPIGGPRQRRLLAQLAANMNRTVRTGELIDWLWEGDPPNGAGRSFKTYVARLRAALRTVEGGSGLIVTHPSGYALEIEPDLIDATRFEVLVQRARAELALGETDAATTAVADALALWRGDPYGNFGDELWAQAHTARLTGIHTAAEELAVEARLAAGEVAELLPGLDELISRFPYRDRLRGLRAESLYRAGRQVDALRELQTYRTLLAEEIGVEPGPELVNIEQQILDHAINIQAGRASPRQLRDYQLGERVGADEIAVVYRASQVSVGRDVALKVIRPDLTDRPGFIQRFAAEAQAMASVEHPNMVPIYDYWREPGAAYLAMRWLGGGSLASRIERQGVLSNSAVVQLVRQIGGVLMISSQAGLGPRALSPSNVLFDEQHVAFVTAFGIDDSIEPAESSMPYLPPEYLQRGELSPRSEVYTLGAIAYQALTGRPPRESPQGPTKHEEPVAEVLRRACSADPADRPPDVADLIVEVRAAAGEGRRGATATEARVGLIADELTRINPYKGLRPFDEGAGRDFFGRAEVVDELVSHVHAAPLTCVVGPSGSGKSSVVRAGLIPELRQQGWFVATMVPGARPYRELDRALTAVAAIADPSLPAQLAAGPEGISRAAHGSIPPDRRLLLVIDQFEEMFTVVDSERRDSFLAGLAHLMEEPEQRVRVVFTLRADFFDRPLLHPAIGPIVRDNSIAITPLTAQQLEAAITGPARLRGVDFEPALVADLVADAAANPGNLPLLQYALTELYRQRVGGLITAEVYAEMGRMSGTLAQRADSLLDELGTTNEEAVRRLFTRLVTAGEGTADTRRRALVSELKAVPDHVIDVYTRARLLTFDRDVATREPTVEVAHEALISSWPRLRRWIDEDREVLRMTAHLTEAARIWDKRGHDAGDLYRSSRLAGATDYCNQHPDDVSSLVRQFVDASTAAESYESRRLGRSRRHFRALSVALAGALLIAVLAGWLAVDRGNEASDRAVAAEVLALSAAADSVKNVQADLAALLAVEATQRSDTADIGPIIGAVTSPRRVLRTLSLDSGGVWAMVGSGDGTRIVVDDGERLRVFDSESFELVSELGEGRVYDVSMSADGSLVGVTYEESGEMVLIDVDSREVVRTIPAPVVYAVGRPEGDGFGVVRLDGDANRRAEFYASATADPVELGPGELLNFSGNGRFALVGSSSAKTWRVDLSAPVPSRVEIDLPTDALFAHLDETGRRLWLPLLSGGRLIDVASGATIREADIDPGVWAVIRNEVLAVISKSSVQLYELGSGTPVGRPYLIPRRERGGDIPTAFDTADNLITAGQSVERWNTAGQNPALGEDVPGSFGAQFSPQGNRLATTTRSAELHVIQVDDRTAIVAGAQIDRNGPLNVATPMEFTVDGSRIVTAGGVGPATGPSGVNSFGAGSVRLIDAESGETLQQITDPTLEATAVTVSPDGLMVAVGYRFGRVEIRSVDDLSRLRTRFVAFERDDPSLGNPDRTVLGLDFSADSTLLRSTTSRGVTITHDLDGGLVYDSAFPADPEIAVLPDGRMIGGSAEGVVTVYGPEGAALFPALVGHTGQILDIAYGGDLVATAASDGTVRLWDLEQGQPVGEAIPVAAPIVDLDPNGRWLATVDANGTRLLDLDSHAMIETACEVAGRNMTLGEWAQYLPFAEEYKPTCPQWPDPTQE